MNIKECIKVYNATKKKHCKISELTAIGHSIINKADSMGKKKIFKPSAYELEIFIDKCKKLKEYLEEYVSKAEYKENIENTLLLEVKHIRIERLLDCRELGNCYLSIANHLHIESKAIVIAMPMTILNGLDIPPITALDFLIFILLLTATVFTANWIGITKHLLFTYQMILYMGIPFVGMKILSPIIYCKYFAEK